MHCNTPLCIVFKTSGENSSSALVNVVPRGVPIVVQWNIFRWEKCNSNVLDKKEQIVKPLEKINETIQNDIIFPRDKIYITAIQRNKA